MSGASTRSTRTLPRSTIDSCSSPARDWSCLNRPARGPSTLAPGNTSISKNRARRLLTFSTGRRISKVSDFSYVLGSPIRETNPVEWAVSGGIGGRGLIPTRDNDTFGIGYYYNRVQKLRISGVLGLENSAQGFECFYNIAITPACRVTLGPASGGSRAGQASDRDGCRIARQPRFLTGSLAGAFVLFCRSRPSSSSSLFLFLTRRFEDEEE